MKKKKKESIAKEVDLILFSCKSFENERLHTKISWWPETESRSLPPCLSRRPG